MRLVSRRASPTFLKHRSAPMPSEAAGGLSALIMAPSGCGGEALALTSPRQSFGQRPSALATRRYWCCFGPTSRWWCR